MATANVVTPFGATDCPRYVANASSPSTSKVVGPPTNEKTTLHEPDAECGVENDQRCGPEETHGRQLSGEEGQ